MRPLSPLVTQAEMKQRVHLRHCYFEMRQYGKYLRVHCIDPATGLEAIATGQRSMGQEALKRNAKLKLEYLLTKKLEAGEIRRSDLMV